MKAIYLSLLFILLLGISSFAITVINPNNQQETSKELKFEFVYAAPEGYNVYNCRFYYPLGVLVEEIDASPGSKLLNVTTKPFRLVKGKSKAAVNCTNAHETDSSSILYEYEEVEYASK
ncbi:MAG: hypothetical protein QF362_04480 [Candidatus Woesearchaeota archaeon]|jgi:hypothetical protein|nr:hypothetical protein [Candidatus Woesearchaeota archaeon]MDP7141465.1 hypothetical protein [Candidatus Woesearchaeota archaeon]MDP7506670.1 hypothetical protein [Candidatus Woesearchaeota archaeon]MDP7610726.1 hypothetical protein [Candidatus Woesearchaeota archaeon]|tara:strand:+ start:145 stop:501 length:357 start_codon:yes stop_codon:yes gene_type:complete